MKYINSNFYVEVKDEKYFSHPTEDIILGKQEPPRYLSLQYQVQNETKLEKKIEMLKKNINELEHRPYKPRQKINKSFVINQTFNLPDCTFCERNIWAEFHQGFTGKFVKM